LNICLNTLLIRTFIQAFRFTRPRTKNPRKKNAKERKRKKGQGKTQTIKVEENRETRLGPLRDI
jgi:hypothetical protein